MRLFGETGLSVCLAAALLCGAPIAASASPFLVSTPGTGVQPLAPSSDSVELFANSVSTPLGLFTLQSGSFNIDYTFLPDFTTGYVINESITVDGNTVVVPISMQNAVTGAADTLTIFGGGPIYVAGPDIFLTILSVQAGPFGSLGPHAFTVTAQLSRVPEPAALALIAMARLSLLGFGAARASERASAQRPK